MTPQKITVIPICPQTSVRTTRGERWMFAVSNDYIKEYDQRRVETHGKAGRNLTRKLQLERYNKYKDDISQWARESQFQMPKAYFAVWFFMPFPKSWRRKKQEEMLYKPHTSTPDLDNLVKGLFDSIMPRRNRISGQTGSDDRQIHCESTFKVWCPQGEEKIIIIEYTKEEYLATFSLPDYFQISLIGR